MGAKTGRYHRDVTVADGGKWAGSGNKPFSTMKGRKLLARHNPGAALSHAVRSGAIKRTIRTMAKKTMARRPRRENHYARKEGT